MEAKSFPLWGGYPPNGRFPWLGFLKPSLSSAILTIIVIAATVSVCVLCKKKRDKKTKRGEQMKTEENTIYGTLEDGPVDNIVTDENAYYSS